MFNIILLVIICIHGEAFAKPVQSSLGNSENIRELSNTRNVHNFLTKYIETKFPNLNMQEQVKMKIVIVQKLQKKMVENRRKNHLKRIWKMKEHSFARMLR